MLRVACGTYNLTEWTTIVLSLNPDWGTCSEFVLVNSYSEISVCYQELAFEQVHANGKLRQVP